jgi:hypothetical protein
MRRVSRAAVFAALILTVGAGVAYATGVVSGFVAADGTITACVQKDSFNTRIVPAGTTCKSTEQLVTFNQKGVKGDQGVQGLTGNPGAPGQSLTAEQLAAGDSHCNGNGGVAISPVGDSSTALGYVCNGADGTNGVDGKDGKDGTNGTNGIDGTNGTNGVDGTNGTNGSDLVGSPCALLGGTPGTVEMTVAANGGISWTCHTATPPNLCPDPLPTYANAVTSCAPATGNVSITCTAGYQDRNGNITDGCEFALSPEVCNGIDDNGDGLIDNGAPVPPTSNGTGGCVNGAFKILSCNLGWADVDGVFADGCEINLGNDPNNCGTPGNRVPAPGTLNANWACIGGNVVIQSCVAGWRDADLEALNGCESQVDPDPTGNTQATAIFLGQKDCFAQSIVNDTIANINDNDWYVVQAYGGDLCANEFDSTYSAAGGVVYDVVTDLHTVTNLAGSYNTDYGFFTSRTLVFIHVHSVGGSGSYSLRFVL